MKINKEYINEYEKIIKTTNLQRGYQEFIKFFRYLRTYLEKGLKEYKFTNNIVENNMDYSYFQFTNKYFQEKGLKFVVVFVHNTCNYEVWLSGMNRKIQKEYYDKLMSKKQIYILTNNPDKTDYILKTKLVDKPNYDKLNELLDKMKLNIIQFISDIEE